MQNALLNKVGRHIVSKICKEIYEGLQNKLFRVIIFLAALFKQAVFFMKINPTIHGLFGIATICLVIAGPQTGMAGSITVARTSAPNAHGVGSFQYFRDALLDAQNSPLKAVQAIVGAATLKSALDEENQVEVTAVFPEGTDLSLLRSCWNKPQ